jgi:hypothetical protein
LPFPETRPDGIDIRKARSALEASPAGMLPPEVLAAVLDAYGIELTPWRLVESSREAIQAARHIGWPVVVNLQKE